MEITIDLELFDVVLSWKIVDIDLEWYLRLIRQEIERIR